MNAENASGTEQYRQIALPHFSHWCMNYSVVKCVAPNSQQSLSDCQTVWSCQLNCFCPTAYHFKNFSLAVGQENQQTSEITTTHTRPPTISWGSFGGLAELMKKLGSCYKSRKTSQPCWSNLLKFSNILAGNATPLSLFHSHTHLKIGNCKICQYHSHNLTISTPLSTL